MRLLGCLQGDEGMGFCRGRLLDGDQSRGTLQAHPCVLFCPSGKDAVVNPSLNLSYTRNDQLRTQRCFRQTLLLIPCSGDCGCVFVERKPFDLAYSHAIGWCNYRGIT